MYDETIDQSKPLTLFDPDFTWKKKTLTDFTVRELQVQVFKNGELTATSVGVDSKENILKLLEK